jgi:hypothetical protein
MCGWDIERARETTTTTTIMTTRKKYNMKTKKMK